MGYTHYWNTKRDFTTEEWTELQRLAERLFENYGYLLAGWNGEGEPECDGEDIRFNGIGHQSHETMHIHRERLGKPDWVLQEDYDRDGEFNFCKTAEKPYDYVVVQLLRGAKMIAPDAIDLDSDGYVFEDLKERV